MLSGNGYFIKRRQRGKITHMPIVGKRPRITASKHLHLCVPTVPDFVFARILTSFRGEGENPQYFVFDIKGFGIL